MDSLPGLDLCGKKGVAGRAAPIRPPRPAGGLAALLIGSLLLAERLARPDRHEA
jgi:hypothetical protein